MRGVIRRWVKDSWNFWGGYCIITGQPSEVIHHRTGFASIVDDALDELRLPRKPVNWYTAAELEELRTLVLIKHYEAGLGVCLTRAEHNAYHVKYGKRHNTPQQFKAWYEERKRMYEQIPKGKEKAP